MRNILTIIKANLQRGKSQAASLLVFALVSALLMNLGLLLMIGFGGFFEKRSEALNAPHFAMVEERRVFSQSQIDYLKNYPGVIEVEYEQTLQFFADITYNGGKMPAVLFFVNADTRRSMNDLRLTDGKRPVAKNEVCLPYMFIAGGYAIGDEFTMTVGDKKLVYKITGFTEEIIFGSINNQFYQLYISDAGFKALYADMPEADGMLLKARLADPNTSERLYLDCINEFFYKTSIEDPTTVNVHALEWSSVKMSRTMMSNITSIILVIFAALIVLVSLLIIRFRIRNTIEESMTNIGALKAVGHTGNQLLWASVLQFCLIALVGVIAGIASSYAFLPLVSRVLELQTAVQWQQGFDWGISVLTLVAIICAVFVVTWFSAYKIRTLQPLAALRQGLSTHSFKRNYFPLDRTRGALAWLLAIKTAVWAKGQMLMIVIILTAVSFMAVAGLAVYANLGLNSDAFALLLSGELPDADFVGKNPEEAERLREALEDNDNTRKVFYNQDVNVMIEGLNVNNILTEDFALLEGALLYEGQYPRHNNEICLSGALASQKNLRIGDSVKVTQGGVTTSYLIVGLIQSVNNGGICSAMTIDGFRQLQPDFKPRELYVYLINNEKTAELIKEINAKYESSLEVSINLKELVDAQLGMYGDIFFMVAAVLLAVTILVILMVLYIVLKTVILRRRRELGIQKALGFTTFQLMNQLALYFIPVIVIGIMLGGLLGTFGFNPMFVALSRNMGIMTASMPAPVALTIIICVLLVFLSYVFAMLIAWRIRKISAYALVTE